MIYCITAPDLGLVKIGYSADPAMRFVKLRADCPVPVVLAHTTEGDRSDEAALHRAFAADRVRGEWFRISEQVERFMAGLLTVEKQPRLLNVVPTTHEDSPPLLVEIRAFCQRHGMSKTQFGDLALGDRPFVGQLERGRDMRGKTIAKVRRFMATYRPERAA